MATQRLTPDFREFLKLLNSNNVEYLLIGGYAVNLYGLNRPTKDMDLWIAVSDENLARVIRTLEGFGFSSGSVKPELFKQDQSIFRMGLPPNRLELFTFIPGVLFEQCYGRRQIMLIDDDLHVPVISYDDLKANKLATGRPSDLGDIEKLEQGRNQT